MLPKDILYVGVDDHITDLFEGQYLVPNGVSYNSYIINDSKIAVIDSVDERFSEQWLHNIDIALQGKSPDMLIVQHMEPDHSSSIMAFAKKYPNSVIVSNKKAFIMMQQYYGEEFCDRRNVVENCSELCLGKHNLTFIFAPMVHWPEVMFTYDSYSKAIFSADAFGSFGANDIEQEWTAEARRYYIGIVGKYGVQVQNVLKSLCDYDIRFILPLHGKVLHDNLAYYVNLYDIWSSYKHEEDGVMIAYTSIYGHTKEGAELLAQQIKSNSDMPVFLCDIARTEVFEAVAQAFRYSKLIIASTTYNADIFPSIKTFVHALLERNYRNRTIGVIENGTWAPQVAKHIKELFCKSCGIEWLDTISIRASLSEQNRQQIKDLAEILIERKCNIC